MDRYKKKWNSVFELRLWINLLRQKTGDEDKKNKSKIHIIKNLLSNNNSAKPRADRWCPEGSSDPAPLVVPVMLMVS